MYKVFIENELKIFQLKSEDELLEAFRDYKFIEAAGGIVEKNNQFLFIKRHGLWDIPKGKIDKGEKVKEAAVREIEEECGLVGPRIVSHLIDTWHTYEYKGKKVLKKTYWYHLYASDKEEVLRPQIEESITEVRYFQLYELKYIKENTYTSIIKVIETLEFILR